MQAILSPAAMPQGAAGLKSPGAQAPSLSGTIQHMAGLLWYEMLSELNKSGLSGDQLGLGGDDFQSMFLWNLSQNDFAKYDTGLLAAATRQVGGVAATAPALQAPLAAPDLPEIPAILQNAPSAALAAGAATAATDAAPPDAAPPARDLLAQAKTFGRAMWPAISAAAARLGVPPVAVLAQSALETGWGSSAPGHNFFGIKAADGEPGTSRATTEMLDGVLVPRTATFRDYASAADSISDYAGLLQSAFPAVLGQSTVAGFGQALQQGGYATDAQYARKIEAISASPLMAAVLDSLNPARKAMK